MILNQSACIFSFGYFLNIKCGLEKIMTSLLVIFIHSCKDEGTHREFKKQCGASCVYYNDELAVLVVLVSDFLTIFDLN